MFKSTKKIHFVGIGGIGMSGIAEILLKQGFEVSGSDMSSSQNTDYLISKGAVIYIGHSAENIKDAEVVVYSSTVHSPLPNLAFVPPKSLSLPPTITVGSIPASIKINDNIEVVVVFP